MEGVSMSIAKKLMDTLKEDIKPSRIKVSDSYMQLVELFPLQSITSKGQHDGALKVIEKLISFINSANPTDEGIKVYLKTLSELVSEFEKENYKSVVPSGKDMLAYLMDLQNLNQSDLSKELGGQPIVSK